MAGLGGDWQDHQLVAIGAGAWGEVENGLDHAIVAAHKGVGFRNQKDIWVRMGRRLAQVTGDLAFAHALLRRAKKDIRRCHRAGDALMAMNEDGRFTVPYAAKVDQFTRALLILVGAGTIAAQFEQVFSRQAVKIRRRRFIGPENRDDIGWLMRLVSRLRLAVTTDNNLGQIAPRKYSAK